MSPTPLSILLNFSANDLLANQNGVISHQQRNKLKWKLFERIIGFGILSIIGGGLLLTTLRDITYQGSVTSSNLISFIGFCTLTVIILVAGTYYCGNIIIDLRSTQVISVSGPISTSIIDDKTIRYKITIGNIGLEISKKAYLALVNGEIYKIYYTPRAKIILSAEKLT